MFGSKFCQGDHLGNNTKELTVAYTRLAGRA
jgi:hypothetical protein